MNEGSREFCWSVQVGTSGLNSDTEKMYKMSNVPNFVNEQIKKVEVPANKDDFATIYCFKKDLAGNRLMVL